jgi:hypothetical protein
MALFQQATADDKVVVEQWALAQVHAIEHTCSESLLGIEAEAERRHRQVMDDAAQTHRNSISATVAQEQGAEAALTQARDDLRLEKESLLAAQEVAAGLYRAIATHRATVNDMSLRAQARDDYHRDTVRDMSLRAQAHSDMITQLHGQVQQLQADGERWRAAGGPVSAGMIPAEALSMCT